MQQWAQYVSIPMKYYQQGFTLWNFGIQSIICTSESILFKVMYILINGFRLKDATNSFLFLKG